MQMESYYLQARPEQAKHFQHPYTYIIFYCILSVKMENTGTVFNNPEITAFEFSIIICS